MGLNLEILLYVRNFSTDLFLLIVFFFTPSLVESASIDDGPDVVLRFLLLPKSGAIVPEATFGKPKGFKSFNFVFEVFEFWLFLSVSVQMECYIVLKSTVSFCELVKSLRSDALCAKL